MIDLCRVALGPQPRLIRLARQQRLVGHFLEPRARPRVRGGAAAGALGREARGDDPRGTAVDVARRAAARVIPAEQGAQQRDAAEGDEQGGLELAEEGGRDGGVGGVGLLEAQQGPEPDGGDDTGSASGTRVLDGGLRPRTPKRARHCEVSLPKRGPATHIKPMPKVAISTTFLYRAIDRP